MKKVAIIQSSYIPWKGYFDMVINSDLFIFYDHVQFTKKDWRSRNYIKTPNGKKWLTIPCGYDTTRRICDVAIIDNKWQRSHWDSIRQNYKKTRYFRKYSTLFEDIYMNATWNNLSELNQYLIKYITRVILGINTVKFEDSNSYNILSNKAEGVKEIIEKSKADIYICGPSAQNYLNEDFVKTIPCKIIWMDYSNYPEYDQLYPPFDHQVSILDLIFNTGPEAINYMKTLSNENNWLNRIR